MNKVVKYVTLRNSSMCYIRYNVLLDMIYNYHMKPTIPEQGMPCGNDWTKIVAIIVDLKIAHGLHNLTFNLDPNAANWGTTRSR